MSCTVFSDGNTTSWSWEVQTPMELISLSCGSGFLRINQPTCTPDFLRFNTYDETPRKLTYDADVTEGKLTSSGVSNEMSKKPARFGLG